MISFLLALLALAAAAACGEARSGDSDGASGDSERSAAVSPLNSPSGPASGEPNLFGAGDRVYLSWVEALGDPASAAGDAVRATDPGDPAELPAEMVHALRFAAWDGETWSEPLTIASGLGWFVNWADFPSLLALPDGSLAAHWLVRTGPETYAYEVRIARSTDGGGTWSEPVVPHRDGTPTEHGFVSLFSTPEGGLGAVWLDGRKFADATAADGQTGPSGAEGTPGTEMTLRAAVIDPAGRIRDEALLDDRACDCCQTGAAVTSRGPVVVFRDRSPDEIRDVAVVRRIDGRWTDPVILHDDGWQISACPVNGPAIAARGEKVAVAWYTAARDTHRVRIAFSGDAGATFGSPFQIDEGAPQGRVDVELLPDRTALVTWLEGRHAEARILARRVAPDGHAGSAVLVAPASAERASGFPRAALLGNRVVFAWTEPGEPSRVRLAHASLEDFPLSDGSDREAGDPSQPVASRASPAP